MKRLYHCSNGRTFADRLEARRFETDLVRHERLTAFFQPLAGAVTMTQIVDAILANPVNFAQRLSARAARRLLNERHCHEKRQ